MGSNAVWRCQDWPDADPEHGFPRPSTLAVQPRLVGATDRAAGRRRPRDRDRRHGRHRRLPPAMSRRGHAHQAAFVRGLEPDGPRHHLPTGQRLLPRRPALDRERGPEQRPSCSGIRHRRPQGDGQGRPRSRGAPCRPIGIPQLLDPEIDLRLLVARLRLQRGAQDERPGRTQRASARDHHRLPELRRIGALVLLRLGHDQGRSLAQEERLEIWLRDGISEGQDECHLLRL